MGFQDLKMFNWALLGKQGWRLVMHPGRLFEQLLEARYYPTTSFLDSKLGSHPSYTWRDIWEAKWVLRRGMRWRVSDGEKIRVWHDAWIPGSQSRKVLSSCGEDLNVGALIDPISRTWNEVLLSQLFIPFEVDRILRIPLSHRLLEDRMCWDLEKSGNYFVKSPYHAIVNDVWSLSEESSSSIDDMLKIIGGLGVSYS